MLPNWASSHTSVARGGARGGAKRGWFTSCCSWGAGSGGRAMRIMWGSLGGCWGEGSPPNSMSSEERGSGGVGWGLGEGRGGEGRGGEGENGNGNFNF